MRLRSALFLDFDNVLIALEKEGPRAANRFCNDPTGWLEALRRGDIVNFGDDGYTERSLLFLRCYANPDLLQKRQSRASFVRSGFSVVDCPPLTRYGKNSADIHIVLDAIGLLDHPTRFDEFIILSADADFTPLLVRLREHDRKSVVFSTQETAGAYKAVAKSLLKIDRLIDYLDPRSAPPPQIAYASQVQSPLDPALGDRMIEALKKAVQEQGGAIPLASAAQIATAACPNGKNQNWAGFGGFRRLLEGIPNTDLVIDIETDTLASRDAMRAGAVPVAGANGFLEDPDVADDIKDLARRLRNILDCPLVKTDAFMACFAFLLDRVTSVDLDLNEIARDTRDRLRDVGRPMSRQNVNYILKGVQLSFASLGVPPTIEAMARGYQFSLSRACEAAGAPLSPAEMATLGRWVGAHEKGPDLDPNEPEV